MGVPKFRNRLGALGMVGSDISTEEVFEATGRYSRLEPLVPKVRAKLLADIRVDGPVDSTDFKTKGVYVSQKPPLVNTPSGEVETSASEPMLLHPVIVMLPMCVLLLFEPAFCYHLLDRDRHGSRSQALG